jgi:hypothetical protein
LGTTHLLQFRLASTRNVEIEIALHGLSASMDSHSSR